MLKYYPRVLTYPMGDTSCFTLASSGVFMQVPLSCYITVGTQLCCDIDSIQPDDCVRLHVRCCGGKGGYGNTLRALGRKGGIADVSDCRDLQGRRLRDVEAAKRMNEASDRKREREAEEHEAKVARKAAQLASKKHEEQVESLCCLRIPFACEQCMYDENAAGMVTVVTRVCAVYM